MAHIETSLISGAIHNQDYSRLLQFFQKEKVRMNSYPRDIENYEIFLRTILPKIFHTLYESVGEYTNKKNQTEQL